MMPATIAIADSTPSVAQTRPLNMGSIVVSDTAGSVAVSPSGQQSCVTITCLGGASAGIFLISGNPDYQVQITASDATLSDGSGTSMTLSPRLSANSVTLRSSDGKASVMIGGELTVPASAQGAFSGDFELIVEYQ